ncbi:hypothetical protein T484DRAFT_3595158 [Baffinella frigidus]|nr:hypothetical protein T484DRAFT_3595158 [Cryptophyta sp. CCMP2293]
MGEAGRACRVCLARLYMPHLGRCLWGGAAHAHGLGGIPPIGALRLHWRTDCRGRYRQLRGHIRRPNRDMFSRIRRACWMGYWRGVHRKSRPHHHRKPRRHAQDLGCKFGARNADVDRAYATGHVHRDLEHQADRRRTRGQDVASVGHEDNVRAFQRPSARGHRGSSGVLGIQHDRRVRLLPKCHDPLRVQRHTLPVRTLPALVPGCWTRPVCYSTRVQDTTCLV